MKKPTFLTLTLFLFCAFCVAQENGVVTYTIAHSWSKKFASCNYISKAQRDREAYVWANDYERKEKAELKFNATESRYDKKPDEESKWRQDEDFFIYRDREKNETLDIMTVLNKDYAIRDSIICQNWKIKNDMKEVAGRICMNASCYDSLKGKEVVAWFALDLPIPAGPDRYCGLPGMILEVNEANGAVVYTATSIIFSEEKMEIIKPEVKKKRKIIDTQEYNRIVSKFLDECKKTQRPYWYNMAF